MIGFKLSQISKKFGSREVFKELDLEIHPGSLTVILGASGCGKSTLIRLLAGLEEPSAGSITSNRSGYRQSFVFQDPTLLSWRTVEENLALPFELGKKLTVQARAEITQALKLVQLEPESSLYPHQLSGGMKMRVSLARALATHPEVMFLDEPFSALDELTRKAWQVQLREIWQQTQMTVVFVTHSLSEALFLADRVLVLKDKKIIYDRLLPFPLRREPPLRSQTLFLEELSQLENVMTGEQP